MTSESGLETITTSKYVSLTTFRRDGTAVSTPVWFVREGESLLVITDPESGKVKRLRRNVTVRLSPCDMRGRVKDGAPSLEGTAELQDEVGTHRTLELITARYGIMGRIIGRVNERRARKSGRTSLSHQGLRITFDRPTEGGTGP